MATPAEGHAAFQQGLRESGYRGGVSFNPAKTQKQARTARLALAIKRGEATGRPGGPASRMAASMSEEELRKFTHVAKKRRKRDKKKKL
jgi:hypothetical protein